jgi:hypothetical protein
MGLHPRAVNVLGDLHEVADDRHYRLDVHPQTTNLVHQLERQWLLPQRLESHLVPLNHLVRRNRSQLANPHFRTVTQECAHLLGKP